MYIDSHFFKVLGCVLLAMVVFTCCLFCLKMAAEPEYRKDFCEARG